jgi:hypothetical protein
MGFRIGEVIRAFVNLPGCDEANTNVVWINSLNLFLCVFFAC